MVMVIFGDFQDNLISTVDQLAVGERAFIQAYEVSFDREEDIYLNLGAEVYIREPPEALEIERTGYGNSDFDIYLNNCDYEWKLEARPFASRQDVASEDIVKVGNMEDFVILEDGLKNVDEFLRNLRNYGI